MLRRVPQVYADPPPMTGNLITNPYAIENASWGTVLNISTRTANATKAPDGSMAADFVGPNTVNGFHIVSQTGMTVSNANYVARCRVKPFGYHIFELVIGSDNSYTNFFGGMFDVGRGQHVGNRATGYAGGFSRCRRLNDGWILCEIRVPSLVANSTHRLDLTLYREPIAAAWTPISANGLYMWGAELAPAPQVN